MEGWERWEKGTKKGAEKETKRELGGREEVKRSKYKDLEK